jgi:type IV pilus assembly protein PilF
MKNLISRLAGSLMAIALLASGCATTGVGSAGRQAGAQLPVSEQTPKNETEQRAKVHTELGALYFVDGRAAVALEEARIALSVDANYAPAYNLLGLVHMSLNEPGLAEGNFRQALRIAPGENYCLL